jgi:hypothetical protein
MVHLFLRLPHRADLAIVLVERRDARACFRLGHEITDAGERAPNDLDILGTADAPSVTLTG